MYYLWLQDRQTGPFSLEEVQTRWKEAAIHGEILYWQEGLADWQPLHAIHHVIEGGPARMITSGFWRRTGALLIDVLLLGLIGYISGLTLFDFYMGLGAFGLLLGLIIATAYFGLLDSAIGSGQTLGKRVFGIQVVNAAGGSISPVRSILRFLVFSLPFWIDKLLTNGVLSASFWIEVLVAAIGLIIFVTLAYLYIFNRGTRQSLHDLAMGTYVVRATSPRPAIAPSMWRGHIIAIAVLFFLMMGLLGALLLQLNTPSFQQMLTLRSALLANGDARTAKVMEGANFVVSPGHTDSSRLFTADVLLKTRPRSMPTSTDEVAALVLKMDPAVEKDESLRVTVTYGYDIGIAWSSVSEGYARTPAEWKERFDLSK